MFDLFTVQYLKKHAGGDRNEEYGDPYPPAVMPMSELRSRRVSAEELTQNDAEAAPDENGAGEAEFPEQRRDGGDHSRGEKQLPAEHPVERIELPELGEKPSADESDEQKCAADGERDNDVYGDAFFVHGRLLLSYGHTIITFKKGETGRSFLKNSGAGAARLQL